MHFQFHSYLVALSQLNHCQNLFILQAILSPSNLATVTSTLMQSMLQTSRWMAEPSSNGSQIHKHTHSTWKTPHVIKHQTHSSLHCSRTHYLGPASSPLHFFSSGGLMAYGCPLQRLLNASARANYIFICYLLLISYLLAGFHYLFPPCFLGLVTLHSHFTHTCREWTPRVLPGECAWHGDMTAVPIWSEQPHYRHHSIRLKCEERVTCLLQWKGGRMSV